MIGSIISGTMRPEDLIPAFLEVLREHDPEGAAMIDVLRMNLKCDDWGTYCEKTLSEGAAMIDVLRMDLKRDDWGAYCEKALSDDVAWLVEDLFNALDEHAPPFCYFGSHPGDNSDYGFWVSDDAITDAQHSGEIVTPEDAPYVLEVSDHGNMTLRRDGETIWSIV